MTVKPIIIFILDRTSYGIEKPSDEYEYYSVPYRTKCYIGGDDLFGEEDYDYYGLEASVLSTIYNKSRTTPYYFIYRNNLGYEGLSDIYDKFLSEYQLDEVSEYFTNNNWVPRVKAIIYCSPTYDSINTSNSRIDTITQAFKDSYDSLVDSLGYSPTFIEKISDINVSSASDSDSEFSTASGMVYIPYYENYKTVQNTLNEDEDLNYTLVTDELSSPSLYDYIYGLKDLVKVGGYVGNVYVSDISYNEITRDSIDNYTYSTDYSKCYVYYSNRTRSHSYFKSGSFSTDDCYELYKVYTNTFERTVEEELTFNYLVFFDSNGNYIGNYEFTSHQKYTQSSDEGCTIRVVVYINTSTTLSSSTVELSSMVSFEDHITDTSYELESDYEEGGYSLSTLTTLINDLSDTVGTRITNSLSDTYSGDALIIRSQSDAVQSGKYRDTIIRDRDTSRYYGLVEFWATPKMIVSYLLKLGYWSEDETSATLIDEYTEVCENTYIGHDYIKGIFLYTIMLNGADSNSYVIINCSGVCRQLLFYTLNFSDEIISELSEIMSSGKKPLMFLASENLVFNINGKAYKCNVIKVSKYDSYTYTAYNYINYTTTTVGTVSVYKVNTNYSQIFTGIDGYIIFPEWYDFWMIAYCIKDDNTVTYLACDTTELTQDELEDTPLITKSYTDYNPGPRIDINNIDANYQVGYYTLCNILKTTDKENIIIGDVEIHTLSEYILSIYPLSYKSPDRIQIDRYGIDLKDIIFTGIGYGIVSHSTGKMDFYKYDYFDEGLSNKSVALYYSGQTSTGSSTILKKFTKYLWYRGVGVACIPYSVNYHSLDDNYYDCNGNILSTCPAVTKATTFEVIDLTYVST